MASPFNPLPGLDEYQIEAVWFLLGFMRPESIKDYAKAHEGLGKEQLEYRFTAIKGLTQEMLDVAIQAAQTGDQKHIMPSAHSQAQPTDVKSLKRPRLNTGASRKTTSKPTWQLDLSYLAACCNKSHKCPDTWTAYIYFSNHFTRHLLTKFKPRDGSSGWVCDPGSCKEIFADPGDFMAHIWKEHMRLVSGQQSGLFQTPVRASEYSPAFHSVPHSPGDDSTFSPHSTASPQPSIAPNAMTPNATVSHTSPFPTHALARLSVEGQSSVPSSMRPAGGSSGNWYPLAMYENNSNMLHSMPHGNPSYRFHPHNVMPNNNATHNNVSQGRDSASTFEPHTACWPDQPFFVGSSSNPTTGQSYPAHTDFDVNANQRFG